MYINSNKQSFYVGYKLFIKITFMTTPNSKSKRYNYKCWVDLKIADYAHLFFIPKQHFESWPNIVNIGRWLRYNKLNDNVCRV